MSVKVGFVGTGVIARSHLQNLSQIGEVEIAALCDIQAERVHQAATEFGGKCYTDYREMLQRERLDALYVCIPPYAHSDQELLAVERGVHLFVEKPVTLDLELGKRVAAAIEQSGVVSCCGYHWRYYDTVDRARQLLSTTKVGLVLGCWLGGIWIAPWWKNKAQSGGQMVEQTTHLFDLARYLVGEVKSVSALGTRGLVQDVEGYTLDDATTVNLQFQNGAIGTIVSACLLDKSYQVGLTLVARRLVLEIGSRSLKVTAGGETSQVVPQVDPLEIEDRTFIEAVKIGDGSKVRSIYADALQTVAVTLAANKSLETGGPIEL